MCRFSLYVRVFKRGFLSVLFWNEKIMFPFMPRWQISEETMPLSCMSLTFAFFSFDMITISQ